MLSANKMIIIIILCWQLPAFSQTEHAAGIIGILPLPEVFGAGACDRFKPEPLPLFSKPGSGRAIGEVRVAQYWTFHAAGGCEGLSVVVDLIDAQPASKQLPVLEYGYEQPGAIVLAQKENWFEITLGTGSAWIHPKYPNQFLPVERFLSQWVYFTRDSNHLLYSTPDLSSSITRLKTPKGEPPFASVRSFKRKNGRLWVRLETLTEVPCAGDGVVFETQSGWMPFHGREQRPAIWFFSRGC